MGTRARILVVDDEGDILTALKSYLEGSLDADVVTAPSGVQALKELGVASVDLIVSDYRMPGMDGIEFLRKARDLAPEVPRVLLTAFPDMHLAIRAVNEASILHFLTKPVDPAQLLEIVRKALDDSRRRRQAQQAMDRAANLRRPPAGPT